MRGLSAAKESLLLVKSSAAVKEWKLSQWQALKIFSPLITVVNIRSECRSVFHRPLVHELQELMRTTGVRTH